MSVRMTAGYTAGIAALGAAALAVPAPGAVCWVAVGLLGGGASVLMSRLVVSRLTGALDRPAVVRERNLRQACGALVAATDPGQVVVAVREAVGRLVPAGAGHSTVIALHDAADAGTVAYPYPLPAPGAERRTRLLPTRTLHPDLRDRLGGRPATVLCPLVVDRRVAGDPGLGALFVAAEHGVLAALQDCLEVLAAQATLALERIALTDSANRRDSDRYVRAVIHNTADVVLIVEDDHRIRYASPSLARLLGADLPLFANLFELVDPADHAHVSALLHRAGSGCWDLRRPDGSRVTVTAECRDLRRDRMVRGFVVTFRDATADRCHEQELIERGLRDSPAGRNRQSSQHRFE